MAHRRKKRTSLSEAETERLIAVGIELNNACCTPLLDVRSEHYRALTDLNQQLVATLRVVTGKDDPPWVSRRTSPNTDRG